MKLLKLLFCCLLMMMPLCSNYTSVNAAEVNTNSTSLKEVSNFKAESAGIHSVKLTWDKVDYAEGYIIYRKIGNEQFTYRYIVKGTSFTDTTAEPGVYNFYRVYPYKMDNEKRVLGPSKDYRYAMPAPDAVTGFVAQAIGINSVKLTWNPVKDADGYIIYRKIDNGNFEYRYMVSKTSYIDTTAKTGVYNFYRVYPYKMINGKRVLGPAKDYRYAKPAPAAVTSLRAEVKGMNSIKLTWNASKDADGYIIYRKVDNGNFEYRYMVSGTSYTDTTAKTGVYSFYRVYPYKNINGKRLAGASNAYVYGKPIPRPVTNLAVSRNSNNGLTLRWKKADTVDGYIVYHKTENETKFQYLGMTKQLNYNHSPIYDADMHFYRVYAYKMSDGNRIVSQSTDYVYGKAHDWPIYSNRIPISNISLDKSNITLKVEDKAALSVKVTPANTSQNKNVIWSSNNMSIVRVDSLGNITAVKEGEAIVTAKTQNGKKASCRVTVIDPIRAGTSSGFSLGSWSSKDTIKHDSVNSRNADGSNTYRAVFYTNGNEKWIDQAVTFEVMDVTPTAYKNMYKDMGIAQQGITYQLVSAADNIATNSAYGYVPTIQEPFTPAGPGNDSVKARSGKIINVNTGMSTRAIKITAKSNGKVLDTVYVASSGKNIVKNSDGESEYAKKDIELYEKVRHKVEDKLWTADMTNLQKLERIETYINQTTHYPNEAIVTKAANPSFWKDWAVDDTILFYDISGDTILNRTMIFQGGITTCLAANVLSTVANDDMGLRYLYDSESDTVASGEGVWKGQGSFSTNPTNPAHVTLWYQSSTNKKTPLDAQGLYFGSTSSMNPCEEHKCREKIISLK